MKDTEKEYHNPFLIEEFIVKDLLTQFSRQEEKPRAYNYVYGESMINFLSTFIYTYYNKK